MGKSGGECHSPATARLGGAPTYQAQDDAGGGEGQRAEGGDQEPRAEIVESVSDSTGDQRAQSRAGPQATEVDGHRYRHLPFLDSGEPVDQGKHRGDEAHRHSVDDAREKQEGRRPAEQHAERAGRHYQAARHEKVRSAGSDGGGEGNSKDHWALDHAGDAQDEAYGDKGRPVCIVQVGRPESGVGGPSPGDACHPRSQYPRLLVAKYDRQGAAGCHAGGLGQLGARAVPAP